MMCTFRYDRCVCVHVTQLFMYTQFIMNRKCDLTLLYDFYDLIFIHSGRVQCCANRTKKSGPSSQLHRMGWPVENCFCSEEQDSWCTVQKQSSRGYAGEELPSALLDEQQTC